MAFTYPVNAPISQPFGVNPASYQPNGHYGIDYACATGTPIRAIGDGVVRWADWNDNLGSNPWNIIPYAKVGSGIFVAIDHGNNYVSLYCHLSETPMNVGDRVTAGSIIGKGGTTGNSTGPHLHLEVIYMPNVNGFNYGRVNPASLMSAFAPVGSTKVEANQRKVGAASLNQRSEPRSSAPIVRVVPGGTVETFSGYAIGEMVDSGGVRSNIWYKDNEGYVWSGGFTEQSTKGLADHTPKDAANQRKVGGSALTQRKLAATSAAAVRTIDAGTTETFTHFVRGQLIDTGGVKTDIWYGDSKGYVWAGGFTEQKTAGLPDKTNPAERVIYASSANLRKLPNGDAAVISTINSGEGFLVSGYVTGSTVGGSNIWFKRNPEGYVHASAVTRADVSGLRKLEAPASTAPAPTPAPAPAPDKRAAKVVVPEGVRLRTQPSTSGPIIGVLEGGLKIEAVAYVEAEPISGSKIWFALSSGYIHSSGVTDASVSGLTEQSVPTAPSTDEEPPYAFVRDFDFVEYKPANTWNMQNDNFPANPKYVVLHQFDDKALKPSIEGVINHFQNPRPDKPSSAHFAVSGKRIVQLVSLKDRAFHAGTVGNDYIGIEVDPQEDSDTVESVKKLIRALNAKYKKTFEYTRHRDVPGNATECGKDIHLEKYAVGATPAPKPTPSPVAPPVVVAPVPVPKVIPPKVNPPKESTNEEEVITEFLDWLKVQYLSRK